MHRSTSPEKRRRDSVLGLLGEEGFPEVTWAAQTQMRAHAGGIRATPVQGGMFIPLTSFAKTHANVVKQNKPSDLRVLRNCGDNSGPYLWSPGVFGDL